MCLIDCLKYLKKWKKCEITIGYIEEAKKLSPGEYIGTLDEAIKACPTLYIESIDENKNIEVLNNGDKNHGLLFFRNHCYVRCENLEDIKVKVGMQQPFIFKEIKKQKNENDSEEQEENIQESPREKNVIKVFYDVETVYSVEERDFIVYQIGYKIQDTENVEILSGPFCLFEFYNILVGIDNGESIVRLISFNGSRFDDLFLQKHLLTIGIPSRCTPVNNSILSLSFNNVKCFDLSRYLAVGSLKSNAESFGCRNKKVEGYNHFELQILFE